MFRVEFGLLLLPLLSGAAAPPDPVDLFRRHRYEEAAVVWEQDAQAPRDEKGLRALKGLSLAYHQLGSLYSRLNDFSLALSAEFHRTGASGGNDPLSFYYLGQVLYQQGLFDSAWTAFETARKSGRAMLPEGNDVFRAFAGALRKGVAAPSMEPKSEAASWQALDLAGAGPSDVPASLKALTSRSRRCRLSILARSPAPLVPEVRRELRAVLEDARLPEISRDSGRGTQMDFYDPFLLETLSRAYLALAQWEQTRLLQEERRFPELARKFATSRSLAETCLLRGRYAEALTFLGDDAEIEARILRAKILGKQGNLSEARGLLEEAALGGSPLILRLVAESYYFLGIDSQRGLQLAAQALKERDGANYYRVSAELLLATGRTEAALREYAKGYSSEFRNRIDQIDPEYMSEYAFALFLNSKMRYEEIVETLYYLQKDVPACRQMHYAMQGISAAQARGYETQRIFRKGG